VKQAQQTKAGATPGDSDAPEDLSSKISLFRIGAGFFIAGIIIFLSTNLILWIFGSKGAPNEPELLMALLSGLASFCCWAIAALLYVLGAVISLGVFLFNEKGRSQ